MNKFIKLSLVTTILSLTVATANTQKDNTINIYGVGAKTDKDQNSHSGVGFMFDSEEVKVKLEGTSDFLKAGAVVKFNPVTNKWYVKVGANVVNQKMYAVDGNTAKVNQYSGALAVGYMLDGDLYVEIGSSYTTLQGKKLSVDYEIKDEITKVAYLELVKRWNTPAGTLDTTLNVGTVYHDYTDNETSSGVGIDLYPSNISKIGAKYQNENNNDVATYSANYGYAFVEYTDKKDSDTWHVMAGLKFAFTNIFDVSSYKMPTNIKPHISELHRFEDVSFGSNMQIQSSSGVEATAEKIARDANQAPTWTATSYATGITVDDNSGDGAVTLKDLTTVSSDNESDTITYSIVSISVPDSADQATWNNSIYLDNGVLKVRNVQSNDPNYDGTVSAIIRATATGGSNDTTISFTFTDVN